MNEKQKSAIDRCVKGLTSELLPDLFLSHLVVNGIFSDAERKAMKKEGDSDNQMVLFAAFNLLKSKKGGWECLMGYLKSNNYGGQWVEDLENWGSPNSHDNDSDESLTGCQTPATTDASPKPTVFHRFCDAFENLRRNAQWELGIDAVNNYNFAVCGGPSGVGKSSLINALRGIDDQSDFSAEVTESETTRVIAAYPMPGQDHIVLWDFPCGGTYHKPAKNYFERNRLFAFDCLIVVTSARLDEIALDIAKQAALYDIPAIFVRNKADWDIGCKMRRGKKSDIEARVELRKDVESRCTPQFTEVGLKCHQIFIVSSWAFTDPKRIQMDEQKLLRFIFRQAIERRTANSLTTASIRLPQFGQFNIGFTGAISVGKSSLIRSIMSLAPTDNNKLPVSEFGSDLPWQSYQNPLDPRMILHEIPYEDKQIGIIKILQIVCVVIAERICSTDIMIVKLLSNAKVPFILVRTKADVLIDQLTESQPHLSHYEIKSTAKRQLIEELDSWDIDELITPKNPLLIVSAKAFGDRDYDFMDESQLYTKIKSFMPTH